MLDLTQTGMVRMGSRLRVKAVAFANCLRFAWSGADWANRRILLYVGIMAHIYPARRRRLFGHIKSYIRRRAIGGLIHVRIRPPGARSRPVREITFRTGDRADYQTAWECLSNQVYPAPVGVDVRHIIDGGANIGLFTVWHSGLPRLDGVVLVEPDPANLDLLRHNVQGDARFSIVPAALSNTAGEAVFEASEANAGRLSGAPAHSAVRETFSVTCKRLADIVPSHWQMQHTWLKLDIEGAEYDVLKDMLANDMKPAAVSVEIHEFPTAGGERLVKHLQEAGYHVEMLDPGPAENTCRQVMAVLVARGVDVSTFDTA